MAKPQSTMQQVRQEALNTLHAFLADDAADENGLARARVATAVLSAHSRELQAQGAAMALGGMLARELARNPEELATYIRAAMPQHPIVRALPPAPATTAD